MKTKVLVMITLATIAMSCKKTEGNNTENQNAVTEAAVTQAPKCGDKEVKEALIDGIYKEALLYDSDSILPSIRKKMELKNILTMSQNSDLQKCECETDFIGEYPNGDQLTFHIYYFAQKDSEGNIIVKKQDKPESK